MTKRMMEDGVMDDIDTELYAARALEDDWGAGARVYTSRDAVYEVRSSETFQVRIRPREEDDRWEAAVRFPVEDVGDAYDAYRDVAESVEEAYGEDLSRSVKAFDAELQGSGTVHTPSRGPFDLTYRAEDARDIPPSRVRRALKYTPAFALASAVDGGIIGGIGGGVGWIAGGVAAGASGIPELQMAGAALLGGGMGLKAVSGVYGRVKEHMAEAYPSGEVKRRAYDPEGGVMEDDVFAVVNEHRFLDRYLEEAEHYVQEEVERFREMDEDELEEDLDALMTVVFDDFTQRDGVIAEHRAQTYEEAAAFVEAVTGADAPVERPSIYADPEAFEVILHHLSFEGEDGMRLLGDGRLLVERAWEQDTHPEVVAWVEETYPEQVTEIGRRRLLESGGA